MYKISRVGDSGTHGARIISGDDTRIANDRKVARIGDLVSCPKHGVNPIIAQAADIVVTGDRKTSHTASRCQCGAVIITGSDDVLINR